MERLQKQQYHRDLAAVEEAARRQRIQAENAAAEAARAHGDAMRETVCFYRRQLEEKEEEMRRERERTDAELEELKVTVLALEGATGSIERDMLDRQRDEQEKQLLLDALQV